MRHVGRSHRGIAGEQVLGVKERGVKIDPGRLFGDPISGGRTKVGMFTRRSTYLV